MLKEKEKKQQKKEKEKQLTYNFNKPVKWVDLCKVITDYLGYKKQVIGRSGFVKITCKKNPKIVFIEFWIRCKKNIIGRL